MRTRTVMSRTLDRSGRLDARYFLSPGVQAREHIDEAKRRGVRCVPLGGKDGVADVWMPPRIKRMYAAQAETKAPYLRPYDVFDYFPETSGFLSTDRTDKVDECRVSRGMILQTRSGRNLGPSVMVDGYLEKFIISDDMIRIVVRDEALSYYVLGFLQSPIGQQLLRRDKTGSVIDHLSPGHVAEQDIPLLEREVQGQVIEWMRRAVELRESARTAMKAMLEGYQSSLPQPRREQAMWRGWTVKAGDLTERLDAASYDPLVTAVRRELLNAGGVRVGDVAKVVKPPGRYKTIYVGPEHGRPIVSGGQLLQYHAINLRYIAPRAFKEVSEYELHGGWVAYQADGRAEGALGTPAFITSERDGWLASGHIGRLIPRANVDSGWLYLAVRTWHAQLQLKSLASGSVVDSTFEWDMENVILPPPDGVDGMEVQRKWEQFTRAREAERKAIALIEKGLDDVTL